LTGYKILLTDQHLLEAGEERRGRSGCDSVEVPRHAEVAREGEEVDDAKCEGRSDGCWEDEGSDTEIECHGEEAAGEVALREDEDQLGTR
jgi:hypothetical protein